jgi:two-component system, OmpR family, phosphate regulon sensor histidine kinase PhoR
LQHVKSKNTLTLALIVSSIVLLLALQVFWLISTYEKAYFDLRRETNVIFRSTVMALRDSLFTQSISPISSDSINHIIVQNRVDTLWKKLPEASSQIRVYLNSNIKEDTIGKVLRPLAGRLRTAQFSGGKSFMIQLIPDSLSTDSINYHFSKALDKNNLNVSFRVRSSKQAPPQLDFTGRRFRMNEPHSEDSLDRHIYSNSLHSDWVRLDPVNRYSVILADFRPVLLKQMAPQILFSIFLTLLTTIAFVVMYRSIKSQQRLMELKNDFISNITHELKTPVTTVGVALEALKSFKGLDNPALTSEYLDIAQNELNRLSILTDKILKASSFENNGVEFNAEPVEFDKIIDQVLGSLKLVFERQQAKISFTKEGTDFQLLGSSVHLTSVVYNLLDNALKYSKEIPEIEIHLKSTPDALTIIIKDHGIGISSEYKKKVFEKFFRVPTGDVHNIKGYGLGLSYVDSVVKSHRGSITVDSEVGKGSEFSIRLPKIN